ncbi:hypothetical protein D083_0100 [Dickeya solani RNS 08.23.3.1.A]|nr:hypothetical protein D083_0100 [Dickeya solani RNS 08.23.3.1.A]
MIRASYSVDRVSLARLALQVLSLIAGWGKIRALKNRRIAIASVIFLHFIKRLVLLMAPDRYR